METKSLTDLRGALESRKGEIEADLARLEEEMQWLGDFQENEGGGLGNHLGDDGSSVEEQERISTVSADLDHLLDQINGALERMDKGTYGICQRCGKPINEERLEAFPYVAFCIECQSILERRHARRQSE
jgi:RNA polymerase-binding transcription factor DksA